MIQIRLSDDALADLDDSYWFYELQDAGLGDYFASMLRSDIESLRITAGVHKRHPRMAHRGTWMDETHIGCESPYCGFHK